jgi:hypothetical protein
MDKLLKIVGGIWALFGAGNIVCMPWGNGSEHTTLLTWGMIFNGIVFVLPGLALFGIGNRMGTQRTPNTVVSDDRRKCPFCAEIIKREAVKCRFCGSEVPPIAAPEYRCKICGHTSDSNIGLYDHVRMTHRLIGSNADEQMEVPLR